MIRPSPGTRPRGATVAITSGKGGVGKTSVTVNLAASLSRLGYRVGVLDADFGLGNIDVMLGLTPGSHLGAVLGGEKSLQDIVVEGPDGIQVMPAGSGIRALTALTPVQWARLAGAVAEAAVEFDFLLLDTAPGVSDNVLDLARLTDRAIVVASYEPTAIVDAYAMVKLLHATVPEKEIGVLVNSVRDADEGERVFRQIDAAAKRFLGRTLRSFGFIARDPKVGESLLDQQPVVSQMPEAPASLCFRRLALRVANLPGGPVARAAGRDAAMTPEEFAQAEAPRCA